MRKGEKEVLNETSTYTRTYWKENVRIGSKVS